MAIKQYSIENDQNQKYNNIDDILMYIQRAEKSGQTPDKILNIFEKLILLLSECEVTTTSTFKEQINKVDEFIRDLMSCITSTDQFASFVDTFFTTILKISKPSGAAGIVLNSLDFHLRSEQNELQIPQPYDSDEVVRRGVSILCQWFNCSFFIKQIDNWINGIIERLQKQKRHELIMKIIQDNFESIYKSFKYSYDYAKVASVLRHMWLASKYNDAGHMKLRKLYEKLIQKDDQMNFLSVIPVVDDGCKPIMEGTRHCSFPIKNPIRYTRDTLVGLVNLGNTCYMNSVLQALTMTKQFSREILLSDIRAPLFQTIQKLLALLLHSIRPALTPKSILHIVQPPGFKAGHQQDSSEFLGHLLETLHEQEKCHLVNVQQNVNEAIILPRNIDAHPSCSKHNETILNLQCINGDGGDLDDLDGMVGEDGARALSPTFETTTLLPSHNKSMQSMIKATTTTAATTTTTTTTTTPTTVPKTIIQKTFGGNVSITYKCLNCCTESKQYDSFRDFQLSFPETDQTAASFTIRDLLEYNCSAEKLDKDNQYSCDQCKMLCDGERYTTIVNAPANLILTLKYFKYDQKYFTRTKLMHKVKYDETINIKIVNNQNESVFVYYRLYAAVVHSGVSLDSGHYFTYGAQQPDQWYRFEDTYVTRCALNDLYDLQPPNTPYILFYRMIDHGNSIGSLGTATTISSTTTNLIIEDGSSSSNSSSSCNSSSSNSSSNCDINIPRNISTNNGKLVLPALEELPPHLREYVNGDNVSYENEWRLLQQKQQQQQQQLYRTANNNIFRDSDNDDPPASCGDSMKPSYNQFIY